MSYSFDGVAKIITIVAQTTLNVRDVYSRWADWVNTSDNAKYLPAFNTVGGETIDGASGTSIPIYAFMQNGWKIRPQESSHTLNVVGGVLLGPSGGDPFINPLGTFAVRINYSQPVQAITVSTGGGASITAADIWAHALEGAFTAEQLIRIIAASAAGKAAGGATSQITFRGVADTKTRITATVDNDGNRSAVTLDAT